MLLFGCLTARLIHVCTVKRFNLPWSTGDIIAVNVEWSAVTHAPPKGFFFQPSPLNHLEYVCLVMMSSPCSQLQLRIALTKVSSSRSENKGLSIKFQSPKELILVERMILMKMKLLEVRRYGCYDIDSKIKLLRDEIRHFFLSG